VTSPAIPPRRGDLPAIVFRALNPGYDLHVISGTYLVLPKGTSWYVAPSLGAIARQLSPQQPGLARPAPRQDL
jgi:hypothetical protein